MAHFRKRSGAWEATVQKIKVLAGSQRHLIPGVTLSLGQSHGIGDCEVSTSQRRKPRAQLFPRLWTGTKRKLHPPKKGSDGKKHGFPSGRLTLWQNGF